MKHENIIQCQFTTKCKTNMHLHLDIEIIYVLDGSIEVQYEDTTHVLNTDDFLLVNSNVRHSWHTDSPVLIGSIFINAVMLTEIFNGTIPLFLCNSTTSNSESYEKASYFIRQIFNYYQTTEGQGILLKNTIYYQLLYLLTTEFIIKKGMNSYDTLRGIQDERMNDILSYLMSNSSQQITLTELADRLYLSVPYVSKYIKKTFGMSFLKLLNNIRLEKAISDLLYTDKTVLKVAMDCGFPSLASFNHAFRESYNMTPTEYRNTTQDRIPKEQYAENSQDVLQKVELYLNDNRVAAPVIENPSYSKLTVNRNTSQRLNKNWCKLINIGSASNLLRYDAREQITHLKQHLNFKYARLWNLLSEEMLINLNSPHPTYNFALIDQVLDFLISIDVKPHIELGYKGPWHSFKIDRSLLKVKYENQIQLLDDNMDFFTDFVRHLVKRYRPEVIDDWYFELEKNSYMHKPVSTTQYLKVFSKISQILKTYIPSVKVGGAGFNPSTQGQEFASLIHAWKKHDIKPDFISIYSFPYLTDSDAMDNGRNPYSPDENYLANQIAFARATLDETNLSVPEVLITEWSFTLSNRNILNDSCFKSAYIFKNIIDNFENIDGISYWVATDIYSEGVDSDKMLFGGCGLLTRNGIHKPAFYALEALNQAEKFFLGKNNNAFVTYNGNQLYYICCHNFKHFNFNYYTQEESNLDLNNLQRLFNDNESLKMTIQINHANNGRYVVKTYSVGREAGNIQNEWKRLGYFDDLEDFDIKSLQASCQPKLTIQYIEATNNVLEIELVIPPHEIQSIIISER